MRDSIDATISDIYEAAFFPSEWPRVLSRICDDFGFLGGAVATESGSMETWTLTSSMEDVVSAFVEGGWPARNERLHRLVRQGASGFQQDFDLFTHEEWEKTPVYRDFLVPWGHGFGAGTLIATPSHVRMIVILERLLKEGPVPADTIRQLNLLRPHMARALVLMENAQRQQAKSMIDSLSLASIAAAIVSAKGRVVAGNSEFEALKGQLAVGAHDQLHTQDEAVRVQLGQALADTQYQSVRSIPVPAANGSEAFVLHVLPLRKDARDLAPLGAAILLASRPMRTGQADNALILRSLYDLTQSEAKIALGILDGLNLPEIAAREGLAYETVRTFAKGAYAKTGSPGQVELVRRLSMLTTR